MKCNQSSPLTRFAAVLVCVMLSGAAAQAGNEHSFFLGDKAALSAGAVTAVNADGASLWYNPAGLASERRNTIDISGSAYMLRVRDYPDVIRAAIDTGDRFLSLDGVDVISVPSALAYVRRISDDVSLGFGLFAPQLDQYDVTGHLSGDDAFARYDVALRFTGQQTTYAGTVGFGWQLNDRLRVGATLALYYGTAKETATVLYGFDLTDPADQGAATGTLIDETHATGIGLSVTAGLQWELSDAFALGLTLTSPGIQVYESVTTNQIDLRSEVAETGEASVAFVFDPSTDDGLSGSIARGARGTLALAWTPAPDSFLAVELELHAGNEAGDGTVARDFLWNARIGGVMALSDTFGVGAGLFTDLSAEPDDPANTAQRVDYYGATAGIHFETPLTVSDNEANSLVFTSAFALRYALGLGTVPRFEVTPEGVVLDVGAEPIDLTFHEISLHIGSGLHF